MSMQVININDHQSISLAVAALSRGELVIYPTETCYGIAVDATNPLAVTQLLAYKGDRHRQVAVAVSSAKMASKYVSINPIANNLYRQFLPGPITVISNSLHLLDPRLESPTGTLGIRIPSHTFCLSLLAKYGYPITATSANTSGKKEPYSLQDWQKYTTTEKQAQVSIFLDGGKLADRPTSTVVDTTLNDPQILRQGQVFLPDLPQQIFKSLRPEETINFAKDLTLKHLNLTRQFPIIFALQGDLGAGKTQFSKGVALGLGIEDNINSPTYTLLHEYNYLTSKYKGVFYHLDTWRLPDSAELESTLHLSTLLKPGNIISMEWAAKATTLLDQYKKDCVIIYLEIKEKNESTRSITYSLSTPEWT